MKSATIFVAILLVFDVSCHHENLPEDILKSITVCQEELGISEAELKEEIQNHNLPNPNMRCMEECLMRVSGLMVDKEVNADKFKTVLKHVHGEAYSDEKLESLIEKCLGEAREKEDKCEFAKIHQKCMMDSLGME
ncbi:uncharacterized protein LOC117168519 [Belonocnema kinseyi]|uniref:uncharacterized protein LOC117168519 n=1 Tax=Belonocnema kinseyi TaxID=2817044 RepID=UPI00143DA504|nr:uncharacterized protein LOC117168519 [Belonocnema kinseyi]